MAKRIVTRIGDIFCAEIDGEYKCYFQYIEKDLSQLNSSVIRAFKRRYPIDATPIIEEIVNDDILFYAHTVLRAGIDYNAWYKVGKYKELGLDRLNEVLWGVAHYHKTYVKDNYPKIIEVNPLENWTIWYTNYKMVDIGVLPEKYYKKIEEGAVLPFSCIVKRLKFGYYSSSNRMYDIIKRRPIAGVNSYTKREIDGNECYFHFIGEDIYCEMIVTPQGAIKLTQEEPEKDGCTFHAHKFWEINWKYRDHITEADFLTSWNKS